MGLERRITNRFGTLLGWNNITVTILGRDVDGITDVEYSDETGIELEWGAGDTPVGHAMGKYTAKASISLLVEELIALQKSLPPLMRLSDIPAFDITVEYVKDVHVVTDRIVSCRIKGNGRTIKQGDGKIIQKLDLVPIEIQYNIS